MGAGYDFACRTCRTSYYLGYGSFTTWMTYETVEEFDTPGGPHGSEDRQLLKNENIRHCLIELRGHDHLFLLWDCLHHRGGVLYEEAGYYGGEERALIDDWGSWKRVDLTEEKEGG